MVMPNRNVFVFDNGFGRNYGASENYSRAVEYKIDVGSNEIKQVWSFAKELGEDFFSPIISDVDYIEESNTRFIVSGALGIDHTYMDSTNHSINYSYSNPKCRILEIDENKNVIYEMIFESPNNSSSAYRGEKLSIYP